MKTELYHESLKLEGERFKLMREIDRCRSVYEIPKLRDDLMKVEVRFEQYRNILDEINKQEALAKIKRRMMK